MMLVVLVVECGWEIRKVIVVLVWQDPSVQGLERRPHESYRPPPRDIGWRVARLVTVGEWDVQKLQH